MIITHASTGISKPSDSLTSNSQNKHQEKSPVSRNSESKHFHSSLHYFFSQKKDRRSKSLVSTSVAQGFPMAT